MDLNKAIEKKRKAFKTFDAMSKEEQRKATERGENPHESKATRKKRKAANLEKRKRAFDKLPAEQRCIMEKLGVSPYQQGQIINRSTTYYEEHGTYVIDK